MVVKQKKCLFSVDVPFRTFKKIVSTAENSLNFPSVSVLHGSRLHGPCDARGSYGTCTCHRLMQSESQTTLHFANAKEVAKDGLDPDIPWIPSSVK